MAEADLPPQVQAEVQRILDAAARRMLAEHLSGKADHSDLLTEPVAPSPEDPQDRDPKASGD